MTILVTGAAGFIGSSYVRLAKEQGYRIVILDAMTYAGHIANLRDILGPQCELIEGDIGDFEKVKGILQKNKITGVVNFAAESHVDNSISGPAAFIKTNITGTFWLLEAVRDYFKSLTEAEKNKFRFLHVSTDEVFGELGPTGKFSEATPYAPNSPYSASKAASDHIVRAWHHTYGIPTVTTNCSNNYGPRQFPEKLIPRMIVCALEGKPLPVYGQGLNIRDWIHVEDHAAGVHLAFEKGQVGQTYCFGGNSERKNIDVVHAICDILSELKPGKNYRSQIQFVTDRLGHDFRYAIDDSKAEKELGFARKYKSFEQGLKQTVMWYLENNNWLNEISKRGNK
jgi:dTDP-glucose 4,6-dehydratase